MFTKTAASGIIFNQLDIHVHGIVTSGVTFGQLGKNLKC